MKTCILAIESSCDDTSAAVIADGVLRSNVTANQKIHEKYGGVIPEAASRKHQLNIIPVVSEALETAGLTMNELHAVAVTIGPGLIGSLMVGVSYAKGLSLALDIPLIAVHHMQAHVLANFIEKPKPAFPFLCLTVSGGHTQIVVVKEDLSMEVLGQTLDDAAGEAFDKSAKLLGLPYPGGPLIDQLAAKGDGSRFHFPRASVPGLNYSFSGVKTAVMYFLRTRLKDDPAFVEKNLHDLAASIQEAINSALLGKLKKAVKESGIREVALAGGVSANSGLRNAAIRWAEEEGLNLYIPGLEYSTDNAAMIAMAAHFKYLKGDFASLDISPEPRLHSAE